MTITKDTILGDILDAAPETAPLFIEIDRHALSGLPVRPQRDGGAGLLCPRPGR